MSLVHHNLQYQDYIEDKTAHFQDFSLLNHSLSIFIIFNNSSLPKCLSLPLDPEAHEFHFLSISSLPEQLY